MKQLNTSPDEREEPLVVGRVAEVVRYPVKSMSGVPTNSAHVGWHGLDGDRRFAFRRLGVEGGFPCLSASRLPRLLLYQPHGENDASGETLPTHVRSPDGREYEIGSAALNDRVSSDFGSAVELMRLKHGIFDEAPISVIAGATISRIGEAVGAPLDRRRFRANIVVETEAGSPFAEDAWVGLALRFGDRESSPVVHITQCDPRCVMIGLDPDTAESDPRVLKVVVNLNDNNAGVYGTVVRTGTVSVGDSVTVLRRSGATFVEAT